MSSEATAPDDCLIVGIGASAGGLDAISKLLRRLTLDHTAFVVVQHLAANQASALTQLLGTASRLKVVTAEDGMRVEANHVYVTPPGATLALLHRTLQVLSSAGARPHMPIDHFFRSLAEEQGNHAIGIVVSGAGADGTAGLTAIKAAGGITFAQDPATAQFEGMARSAIESGSADFCLSPEAIADEVMSLSTYAAHAVALRSPIPHLQEHFGNLATLIKSATGIDLTHFKLSTLERRIRRRMVIHRLERVADYVRLCETDAREALALHNDLLINVTSFFRDGEPFDLLKARVIPDILDGKQDYEPLRIWVPACSSGEEAYSIAICVLEVLDEHARSLKVQIFGTDVDEDAVQAARRGIYTPCDLAHVSPERVQKYFIKTSDGRYQVCGRLRDLLVFSTQNVNRDAPFSRLDLVSCRNLLIYFQRHIQARVLRTIHYALNPGGFLLLGASETAGESADLFTLVDRQNKLYAARPAATAHFDIDFGARTPAVGAPGEAQTARWPQKRLFGGGGGAQNTASSPRPTLSLARLADHRILEQHAPPGVVINGNFEILYFRGQTERYLRQPSGLTTHNVLRLVRPELHAALKRTVESVLATGKPARMSISDSLAPELESVSILAQPLQDPGTLAPCVLVLFNGAINNGAAAVPTAPEDDANLTTQLTSPPGNTMPALEEELARTRDYLQGMVEELERTNEDLQSSNEELQSTNEELQSMNEEMATSKEELQAANEELITLNDEVQTRMRDLSSANDDLHNILLGVDHPVVIVGLDLRLRKFTHAAEQIFNLLPTDVGRSVSQLSVLLGNIGLEKAIAGVIENVAPFEREVQATDGRWYRLRVLPYRTRDLVIQGALISLADIEHLRVTP